MAVIYALTKSGEPASFQTVRYIGRTVNTPEERLRQHLNNARNGMRRHVYNWIRSLGEPPKLHVLCIVEDLDSLEFERRFIAGFKANGAALTNHIEGGEGVIKREVTEETRLRLSLANSGRKLSAERREQSIAYLMAYQSRQDKPPRQRNPMKQSTREKIAAAHRGKKQSAEHRRARSLATLGSKLPEEQKRKISASIRSSEAFRLAMAARRRGGATSQ